jgi:hypothetical protein
MKQTLKFLSRLMDSADKGVEAHLFLVFLSVVALCFLSALHVLYLKQPFSAVDFGQGAGWILGGGGAAAFGQGLQRKHDGGLE